MIIDNVSYTFSDYPVYQLDSNLRNFTASVPGTYTIAVSGDNQSQLIEFKVPKTYEGVSLNNYTCYVNYTTSWLDSEGNPSNGSKIIYQIENTNDDYLHYGWILDSAQTYKAGRVVFGLSWKSPGTSTYLFNTLISSFLVLDGLGIQPAYVSESDADKLREEIEIISQSLSELTDIVNNMVDQTYSATSEKAQSGKAVAEALGTLDKTDTEVAGQFVSKVSETNGIIDVTRKSFDQTYDTTSTNGQSGKAVHEAFTKEYITSGRLYGSPMGMSVTIEGNGNSSSGNYSHSEGSGTVASGMNSHTEGEFTQAAGANQHVQGKYNELDTENAYAHIVGNGTDDTHRSNAHTLDWDGNAWYAGKVSQAKEPTKKDDLATVNYVVEQGSHDEKVKGLLKEVATPATFVDSDGDAIRNLKVVGASYQNGTPTPTAPIAIQNTGDTLKLTSCGKNLLPYPYIDTTKTSNGITFTDNGDGTITANGTATGVAIFKVTNTNGSFLTDNGFLSGCPAGGSTSTYYLRLIYYKDNIYNDISLTDTGSGVAVNTPQGDSNAQFVYIGIASGTTVSNLVFKPQLEVETSATSYEPYQGNNYTIPLTDINGTSHTMRQFDEVKKYTDGKWYFEQNSDIISFDGTESIIKTTTSETNYTYYITLSHDMSYKGICNKLNYSSYAGTSGTFSLTNTATALFFNIKDLITQNTAAAVKAKLIEWNTAGTPLTVLYQTATTTSYELSTETAQKLESIYSQKGNANIYFTNDVTPSGSFEYVQALEESIIDVGNEHFYKFAENSLTTPANITDSYGGKLINEVVTGKSEQTQIANTNLLPYPYSATTTTQNGITFTDNGNGTITVNGIATANITFQFISNNSTILNGIYTLSGCPIGGGYDSYYLQVTNHYDLGNNVSFTVTNTTIGNCFIVIKSGVTINNLVFKPQLQTGSTATAFVQPTGGMGSPSPNYPQNINNVGDSLSLISCGKNLIPKSNKTTYTTGGITIDFDNDTQIYTLNGTTTQNVAQSLVNFLVSTTISDKYSMFVKYISGSVSIPDGKRAIVYFRQSNDAQTRTDWQTLPNLTTTDVKKENQVCNSKYINDMYFYANDGVSFTNYKCQVQLQTGTTATSYESYQDNMYTIPLTDINGASYTMRQFDEVKKHEDGKWYFDCQSHYVECNGTESNWTNYASQNGFIFITTDIYSELDGPGFCNKYKRLISSTLSETGVRFGASSTSNNVYFFHVYTDSMTLDAWKQQLATWNTIGTPLTFLYKTKTVTSYELSAETSAILDNIVAQKGNANIYFTNAVTPIMTANYPLDLKLYTDNKMSALEARITALENIQ